MARPCTYYIRRRHAGRQTPEADRGIVSHFPLSLRANITVSGQRLAGGWWCSMGKIAGGALLPPLGRAIRWAGLLARAQAAWLRQSDT